MNDTSGSSGNGGGRLIGSVPDTNYCVNELDAFRFFTQTRKLNIVVTVLIILVGLVGNGLAVFVFAQKRFRRHSSSVYLLCLCLSDGLFLLMHFFEDTLRTYIDVYTRPVKNSISPNCQHLLTPSDEQEPQDTLLHHALIAANITDRFEATCGLVNLLRYFMRFVSAYVIVAFTLQRTLAIHSPFFQSKFASTKLAWSIAGVIGALGLVATLWVPFLFTVVSEGGEDGPYCDVHRKYSSHYFVITIIYITLIMLIPIVVIFVCNTLIIYYVFEASKIRLRMMNLRQSLIHKSPPSPPSPPQRPRSTFPEQRINGHQNLSPEEIKLISRTNSLPNDRGKIKEMGVTQPLDGDGAVLSPTAHTSRMVASPRNSYKPGGDSLGAVNVTSAKTNKSLAAATAAAESPNHKITRMLLLMSFSYAILNLPYFVSWCLFFYRIGLQSQSMTRAIKYWLFSAINLCEIVYVLNYGVHFFIYCASGRKFRQQLRSAFAPK